MVGGYNFLGKSNAKIFFLAVREFIALNGDWFFNEINRIRA